LVSALAEQSAGRWSDLGKRTLSAAVMGPVALACVWVGGVAFILIITAAMLGLVIEWSALCRRSGWVLLFPIGLTYVGLAGAALLWLRDDPVVGRGDVLFLLLVVWAGDIAAYLTGRFIGGPRLSPAISPGKTWSGTIGGLLAAVAAGLLAAELLFHIANWHVAAIAALFGIIAQAGDLLESFVKRRLEVKDSGHLIPGHGGLFDRLDSMLAAAPVAALLALTLGRGVVLWQ
jgi:phosphatidate cytidylyltransferase